MRKILFTLLCAFSALFFLPNAVTAEVLLHESFNQTTATLATNDNVFGAEIAATGWTNINGSGQVYMNSTNLSYPGYKTSADTEGGAAEYKATFGKKAATPLSSNINSGSIYAAAIMNISAVGASGRDYNFALCTGTSSLATATNQFARINIRQGTSSGFRIAISKGAEANTLFLRWSDDLAFGTYLVVVEYQFISGDNNDVVKLYMNPVKGDKPKPTLTCVQDTIRESDSRNFGASQVADASGLRSVMLYSSSSNKAACLIDELKVVTSWDDLWDDGETPESIDAPEPKASSISLTSATISWDAVENADSYVLQWKVNGGSYSDDIAINKDVRSYPMSGLESETKYFVRVKTIIGEDASDWAEINFTTEAEPDVLVYKEITFNKYSTQDAMPTSGQVFLAKNVVEYNDVTLTGDLKLNLHGKQLFLFGTHIIVPDGVTLTIFDDAGTGNITGGYPGSFTDKGLITVQSGGTLVIGEGAVVNLSDDTNDYNIAIDNNNGGTFKLSGAPVISGVKEDIHLNSNAITIESGKPLTNSIPYKVFRLAGVITDGWVNMSGANPSLFFTSASTTHKGIILNGDGEAELVFALALDEEANTNESRIAEQLNQTVVVAITRSTLTSSQYNTFCLPFALDNDQLEDIFGAGYDLEKLTGSSLDDDELTLTFDKVTALEAGKPYLLQPSVDVANPSFEGVTIGATAPVDIETSLIDFKGTFYPTELEVGNHNILCLGASNSLFWPNTSNPIKGFRAYFEVKGDAKKAKAAHIVKKEDQAQALDNIENTRPAQKRILNGQLVIEKNGTLYNAQGQIVK